LFLQLLTVLAEKPPASAGYRGSDLVHWRIASLGLVAGNIRLRTKGGNWRAASGHPSMSSQLAFASGPRLSSQPEDRAPDDAILSPHVFLLLPSSF
jgi:hypothetical protein